MAKKVKVSKIKNENEILKLLKLVIIVSLIVAVFYVITLFVNKKEEEKQETTINETPATIQYDYILVGNILKQSNKKYYVLATTQDDVNARVYEAYLSVYKNQKDSIRTYYIDLDNPLNSKFLKEESNFKFKNVTDISFKETTLLLIENNKIKKTYEGKENIIDVLTELIKTEETDK